MLHVASVMGSFDVVFVQFAKIVTFSSGPIVFPAYGFSRFVSSHTSRPSSTGSSEMPMSWDSIFFTGLIFGSICALYVFSEVFGRITWNHADARVGEMLSLERLAVYLPGIVKLGVVRNLPAGLVIAFLLRMSVWFWYMFMVKFVVFGPVISIATGSSAMFVLFWIDMVKMPVDVAWVV